MKLKTFNFLKFILSKNYEIQFLKKKELFYKSLNLSSLVSFKLGKTNLISFS